MARARTGRKTARTVDTPSQRPAPTAADVARRAYELYEARGGAPGADLEDWLQAERELNAVQRDEVTAADAPNGALVDRVTPSEGVAAS